MRSLVWWSSHSARQVALFAACPNQGSEEVRAGRRREHPRSGAAHLVRQPRVLLGVGVVKFNDAPNGGAGLRLRDGARQQQLRRQQPVGVRLPAHRDGRHAEQRRLCRHLARRLLEVEVQHPLAAREAAQVVGRVHRTRERPRLGVHGAGPAAASRTASRRGRHGRVPHRDELCRRRLGVHRPLLHKEEAGLASREVRVRVKEARQVGRSEGVDPRVGRVEVRHSASGAAARAARRLQRRLRVCIGQRLVEKGHDAPCRAVTEALPLEERREGEDQVVPPR
mmetsp:Transcript_4869/g.15853  ORF Transcript_4869/g.15853 Transcript_4869/m.15853 type:complete len:281 (-) Transcript_4869:357-1199(-)